MVLIVMLVSKLIDEIEPRRCYSPGSVGSDRCGSGSGHDEIAASTSLVFGCLTNTLAPSPIALESCSRAQTDRPV